MPKKYTFVLIMILFQFQFVTFACDIKEESALKEKKISWLKQTIYQARGLIIKNPAFSPQPTTNKAYLTALPDEVNLHILEFVEVCSLISLKNSCQYFGDLIDDKLLRARIPLKVINFFPVDTRAVDIVLGDSLFNIGIKKDRKKLIKKAALLGHREAIEWIRPQRKKQPISTSNYLSGMGAAFAWGGGSMSVPVLMPTPYFYK